jgi:hypothetical protein
MWGCTFPTIPKWFGQLRNLQTLSFYVRGAGLKDDGVAILAGLPSLVYLYLRSEGPLEERVHIPDSGMAFPALKEFRSGCYDSGGSVEGPLVDGIEHLPAGLRYIQLEIYGGRAEDKDALMSSLLKIAFKKHHPGAALGHLLTI